MRNGDTMPGRDTDDRAFLRDDARIAGAGCVEEGGLWDGRRAE